MKRTRTRLTGLRISWVVAALSVQALTLSVGCLSQLEPNDRKPPRSPAKLFSKDAGMASGSRSSRAEAATAGSASADNAVQPAPDASTPMASSEERDAESGTGAKPDIADGGEPTPTADSDEPTGDRFMSLAVEPSTPLTQNRAETAPNAPPAGWDWYPIDDTYCRDGSDNGVYMRRTDSDKLLIYFEGGGVCTTVGFCRFNPPNLDSVFTSEAETVLDFVLGVGVGRQQPGVYNAGVLDGIFSNEDLSNPFKDWNMVYIPYCTGDLHFGSNAAGRVVNLALPQQFVGYQNTRKFMSHVAPTFRDKVDRVVVTGANAGSFGAALNYSMIADSFGPAIRVDAVLDSGALLSDAQLPACLQKRWRELWKLDDSLPPDCSQCFENGGGGLIGIVDFLMDKHPSANVALISSLHDEVARLLFSAGDSDCEYADVADPVEITVGQILGSEPFPADEYEAGLLAVRARYDTQRLSSYFFGGSRESLHQHIFRARYFDRIVGEQSIAEFLGAFLKGEKTRVGP